MSKTIFQQANQISRESITDVTFSGTREGWVILTFGQLSSDEQHSEQSAALFEGPSSSPELGRRSTSSINTTEVDLGYSVHVSLATSSEHSRAVDGVARKLRGTLEPVAHSNMTESNFHGSTYSLDNMERLVPYIKALRASLGPAARICEAGFAGGQSPVIFLHALPYTTELQASGSRDFPLCDEDAVLARAKNMLFPNRQYSDTERIFSENELQTQVRTYLSSKNE
jgi:hypothetical protein